MQLYHKLRLNIALFLLDHNQLQFVDVWYYNKRLHKECIITFTRTASKVSRLKWKRDLLKGVSLKIYRLTYIHFGDTML